ncbi:MULTISPECIES: GPP34 family phosphoprotein [Streptacidiphilus]|uniref:GPP34 family phosphoprotein n=1 Tax=Streptacidiphilus cavernicola TaxID=3342716 RepID=A0ABV6UEA2_9ACTN|nr:GPP34 family phosphoprotein [Streptacidiphilus jeojiense]
MDEWRTTTSLPEDLLLLCADPGTGRIRQPGEFRYALAGAALAELLAAQAAVLEGNGRLVLLRGAPLGHPGLDAVAAALAGPAAPPRGARLRTCVNRAGRVRSKVYLEVMAKAGLVDRRRRKVLGLIPFDEYTVIDSSIAAARRALVADAVDNGNAPARSLQLAALAHAGELTGRLYPGPVANRTARRRLADLARLDPVASAAHAAVRAAKSAQSSGG